MTQYETCGICLDWHKKGEHCATCGAIKIGNHYYDLQNGRLMGRALPRPVYQIVDRAINELEIAQ